MKRIRQLFNSLMFFHFAPDNYVIPILRSGRYHRVGGPGPFLTLPLLERTLPAVKKSLHVADFLFQEVLSGDNIPFSIKVTVLYAFEPEVALKEAAAQLVQGGDELLNIIVRDYSSQGLRRLTSKFGASDLTSAEARYAMEQNLARFLRAELRPLGLAPLKNGGILIKEIMGHEKFRRAMLDAKRLDANLQVVSSYHAVGSLIQQAIQAGFVSSLEEIGGNLTLLSTLAPLEQLHPSFAKNLHQHPLIQNGHSRQN